MAILYVSTRFEDSSVINGNPATGIDGYGASCIVGAGGIYTQGGGTITSLGIKVGNSLAGNSAQDPFGPYHQPVQSLGGFAFQSEEQVFGIAFWNTADANFSQWTAACNPSNGEETDWAGNPDGSGGMVLHTPNQTDDVYTLIVPTTAPLRQATNIRNGNSIVFHIPQNDLAETAINANLVGTNINPSMTDQDASEEILLFGYGLILRAAGADTLFNQT
jgi:hypothetical protein